MIITDDDVIVALNALIVVTPVVIFTIKNHRENRLRLNHIDNCLDEHKKKMRRRLRKISQQLRMMNDTGSFTPHK